VANLTELGRAETALDSDDLSHLQRLTSSWSVPCDLSFGDLLLAAPTCNGKGFVVLAHSRSLAGSTVHHADPVGRLVEADAEWVLRACFDDGRAVDRFVGAAQPLLLGDDDTVQEGISPAVTSGQRHLSAVPVRRDDQVIAVLSCESQPGLIRRQNQIETVYRGLWERFAAMVSEGSFPLRRQEQVGEFQEPRVGDGVVVLNRERRVEFVSPNGRSALHRLGVRADSEGHTLAEIGIDDAVVRRAFATQHSTVAEIESEPDVTVVVRVYPLASQGRMTGAVAVLRDVSEIRSRDRLLVSKDTTIREIHHRVKNNLQTIQSLLRLQVRRLATEEARAAVEQSARRIGSIAIVHETLSTQVADVVDFDVVVKRVVGLVQEGLSAPERPLRVTVTGSLGELSGTTAMPLAVALAELVQNAIDHAVPAGSEVSVELTGDQRELVVRVRNDGEGVSEGFSLDRDAGLGLVIVRTFVVHDLGGTITFGPAFSTAPRGTLVELRVPRRSETLPLG